MSVEAVAWAYAQRVGSSSAKSVLVALANCANQDGECWPSTKYLEGITELNRKTVLACVQRLREAGFILDTDERRGNTRQVVVYQLDLSRLVTGPKTGPLQGPDDGLGNAAMVVPLFPEPTKSVDNFVDKPVDGVLISMPTAGLNSPKNGGKQSQKRTETGPFLGHGTVRKGKEINTRPEPLVTAVLDALLNFEARRDGDEMQAHERRRTSRRGARHGPAWRSRWSRP